MPALQPPPLAVCEQARLSRDARFDGLFFTAVRSTGIYCRPVCPAPAPKPYNIHYYANAAAAEAAGYRPCLRCRPELSPAAGLWRRGEIVLGRALQLIEQGALEEDGVGALAERLHVGERQLRRLFASELGASPLQVESTRRLLFAKQLLTETTLPVTEIAMAAGFASLRRFNAAFLQGYGLAPGRLRREQGSARQQARSDALVLRLNYRPPYDFAAMLDFLGGRALAGLEQVDAHGYARVIDPNGAWLRVSHWPGSGHALRLELEGVAASGLREAVQRVRRMFDLDADPAAIAAVLSQDPVLAPLLARRPGLRLPSGWDGFEIAVRAIIGQQISVAGARTLTQRLLARCGEPVAPALAALGFERAFPGPAALVQADLQGLGLTGSRQRSLHALAGAVLDGTLAFRPGAPLDDFVQACIALPGVGPWTAHYLAMRALGQPDALPSGDLVLRKALSIGPGPRSAAQVEARAACWRPWRSYAVMHLWRSAAGED